MTKSELVTIEDSLHSLETIRENLEELLAYKKPCEPRFDDDLEEQYTAVDNAVCSLTEAIGSLENTGVMTSGSQAE